MAFDFNGGYNRNNFINFLRTDLFRNKFTQQSIPIKPERKTAFFVENGIYKLGTIELGDEEISVFEIKQSSKNDPRVTLTQDTFKLMGDLGIDNAIVALYVDDKSSWRFSLLTTKYEDFKKSTSNPKRFSFILGPNEKVRTVNQQLIKKGEIKDFKDLIDRFNVEVVRKEFFDTYLDLFVRLYKEIQKDKPFVELLESQNKDVVSFTKNLLGKIIFLYFVQQKGWLGLGKDTKYGEGKKDFMRILWDDFQNHGERISTEKTGFFYNDYLEWLFFAGLNIDRRQYDDRFPNLKMKVPYLNGGLFKEEYTGWESYVTKISNDIFSNESKKGQGNGDGILDIFDRYNFTIDEDSLYDTDIAVDPEMLGRIFERMISIRSDNINKVLKLYENKNTNSKFDFGKEVNKEIGAFYTPREIVHYMTRESLIQYLTTKIGCDKKLIELLFELKDNFLLNSDDMKKSEYSHESLKLLSQIVSDVDTSLKEIQILDPAIGSGAFPMGLLHEISSLRYYIYGVFYNLPGISTDEYKVYSKEKNKNIVSFYKIKREIILNNIYGVDIDPGAIDIAKLRFWLSLVVDEEEPEPLPNFEFKFVCANSLVPLEEGSLFTNQETINKLINLRKEYYECDDELKKKELKKLFSSLRSELTGFGKDKSEFKTTKEWQDYCYNLNLDKRNRQILERDPFEIKKDNPRFDPEIMFGIDFFDIIIGNPPYIRERGNAKFFDPVNKSAFGKKYHQGKMDFRYYFLHKGIDLLKENGYLIYITNSYRLKSEGSSRLIERIGKTMTFERIIDFGGTPIFQDVNGKHMIHGYIKKIASEGDKTLLIKIYNEKKDKKEKIHIDNNLGEYLNACDLIKNNKIYIDGDKKDIFGDKKCFKLGDKYDVSQGVVEAPDKVNKKNLEKYLENHSSCDHKVGDGVFILSQIEINDLNFNDLEKNIVKKYLNSSDIERYKINFSGEHLLYTDKNAIKNIESGKMPNIKKHLDSFKGFITSSNGPYGIHRTRKSEFFESEKLICKGMFKSPEFCYDPGDYFVGMSFSVIIKKYDTYDLKFLLGIMNSKLGEYRFNLNGKKRGIGVDIGVNVFREFPVIDVNEIQQGEVAKLVDMIINGKKNGFNTLSEDEIENKINQKVYELYGLTDEEIQIIEDSFK